MSWALARSVHIRWIRNEEAANNASHSMAVTVVGVRGTGHIDRAVLRLTPQYPHVSGCPGAPQ